jgi:hypothetical protein
MMQHKRDRIVQAASSNQIKGMQHNCGKMVTASLCLLFTIKAATTDNSASHYFEAKI